MNRVKICFFIVMLLITTSFFPLVNSNNVQEINDSVSYDEKYATLYYNSYDMEEKRIISDPIKDIEIADVEIIKEELLEIQDNFDSSEKIIEEQINVLHKWDLIPDEITFDELNKVKDNIVKIKDISLDLPTIIPGVVVYGPSISSRLAFAGVLLPLIIPLWDIIGTWGSIMDITRYDIFNGTKIMKWFYIVPISAYYCSSVSLINTYGMVFGPNMILSPFMAIDIIYAGFSITVSIWDDHQPVNILDWGVGVCLTGVTVYVEDFA